MTFFNANAWPASCRVSPRVLIFALIYSLSIDQAFLPRFVQYYASASIMATLGALKSHDILFNLPPPSAQIQRQYRSTLHCCASQPPKTSLKMPIIRPMPLNWTIPPTKLSAARPTSKLRISTPPSWVFCGTKKRFERGRECKLSYSLR